MDVAKAAGSRERFEGDSRERFERDSREIRGSNESEREQVAHFRMLPNDVFGFQVHATTSAVTLGTPPETNTNTSPFLILRLVLRLLSSTTRLRESPV